MARVKRDLLWSEQVYTILKNYKNISAERLFIETGISALTIRRIRKYYDLSNKKIQTLKRYLKKVPYLNFTELNILRVLSDGKERTSREIAYEAKTAAGYVRSYLIKFESLNLVETNVRHNFTRVITDKGLKVLKTYNKIINLLKELKKGYEK